MAAGFGRFEKKEEKMGDNTIVPFGKYKGQPVEVMAGDRQYIDWLLAQDGFRVVTFA